MRWEQILESKVQKLFEYLDETKIATFSKTEWNFYAMLVREDRLPLDSRWEIWLWATGAK